MSSADPPGAVLGHLGRLAENIGDPLLDDFLTALPKAVPALRKVEPRPLPVLAWLDRAREQAPPAGRPLLDYLGRQRDLLHWGQTYGAADFGAAFLERYGWSEFVGQRGPIPSEGIACGVLFLGPETGYPSHSHEAEEVYVPLSGRASWQKGEGGWKKSEADWQTCEPLSVIHHPNWTPHAMRTGAEPLVALYLWRGGNLMQKSRIG